MSETKKYGLDLRPAVFFVLNALLIAVAPLAGQSNANQTAPQPTAPASPGKTEMISQSPQAPGATQPQAPPPAFEVATIKTSKPDPEQSMMMFTADGVSITGIPLAMIIREAFNVEDDHIIGEPSWAKSSRFDIEAKVAPDDAPKLKGLSTPQRKIMLIGLLTDRFGLKYHHETRDLPVYELVIAKGGVRMSPAKVQDPAQARHMMMFGGPGKIESTSMKTSALAHVLSMQLRRTVIDKTGLTGQYDFTLTFAPDEGAAAMAGPADGSPATNSDNGDGSTAPSLFTAVEEQLGLKLESAKGPEDVIVIDQIAQPSAN
ncbi:MAG TPA: TIGR03435 family protein [Terracidiphilus sp.]|nr:TIGR03435 family protein [Terracidiphilus sp.]